MGPIIQNPHALKAGTGDSHSVRAAEGCLGMCPQVRENHSGLQMLTMCLCTQAGKGLGSTWRGRLYWEVRGGQVAFYQRSLWLLQWRVKT